MLSPLTNCLEKKPSWSAGSLRSQLSFLLIQLLIELLLGHRVAQTKEATDLTIFTALVPLSPPPSSCTLREEEKNRPIPSGPRPELLEVKVARIY
mmetsp:Transcript_6373/g.19273  ORF Transcript_6373/g.19273 Transcript_6373/m.19273 type:complete len:95 (+) Transcript_6373:579-863(+)